jgi:Transglycosylase-like domain
MDAPAHPDPTAVHAARGRRRSAARHGAASRPHHGARLRRGSRCLVAGAVVLGLVWGFGSAAAAPDGVASAQTVLERATAGRRAAEATVAARQDRVEQLEDQAAELGIVDAALTKDLAEARRQLREYAVAAYIDGGQSEVFRSSLSPEQASALAWQSNLAAGQSSSADEAADRFESLKETNTPARLQAAADLDAATRELEEARFDAIQAAAFERDAEAALATARQAAAQQAAATAAAEKAAQQAQAAAQQAPRTTSAPRAANGGATAVADVPSETAEPAPEPSSGSGGRGDPTAEESAILSKIRQCESRGNYSIVSASGRYRGAYQFDQATWNGVGGTGDPAAASPEEQDYRALLLLRQRGTRPWPNCGR